MSSMRNWMLVAAMVAGAAGLGTATAQAAEFGFHARGPVAYVPPCPGPGYVWVDGYMANGYWVSGFWSLRDRGYGPVVRYDRGFNRGFDHRYDRGGYDRHFDRDRGHEDRDRGDRGHERFHR